MSGWLDLAFAGLSPEILVALAVVALVAGVVDGAAGGGGLITVPALVLAGLDPVAAIATNKLQGVFSTGSAAWSFLRARLLDPRTLWPMALVAFLAAIAGAYAVRWLPVEATRATLPWLLIAVALWFALAPRLSDETARPRIGPLAFGLTAVPLIGFYDGAFGPGAGSFYMLAGVALLGLGLTQASARTKALNLASNGGSLVFFALAGQVVWGVGLVMALGAVAGGRIGSRLAIRRGALLIRPMLVVVTLALAARLFWSG